ncbi:hypothetical protein PENSUB_5303 [Penicillium subrubescens]|uniref:Uncharacterized protein n=1 Tax=Penicillium subrubescens TaxID=1316194 RepID=A0A1Q5UA50_9EURO|nr:hypothetical protein PENSUB_5303 [Penicillium subrubescens]
MAACPKLYRTHSSEPPQYIKHDWQSAERFWDMRGSWTFFRKLREAFHIDQAFLKSRHWLTSPQELQYRKYILSQAMTNVKKLRRQITRGDLSFEVINKRRPSVYGAYAQAMNETENWMGRTLTPE